MTFHRAVATALASLAIAALAPAANAQQATAAPGTVVATVNSQKLTIEALTAYQGSLGAGQNPPPADAALDQLIGIELMYQEGKKAGVEKQPDVQADLENQRRNIVARAMMRKHLSTKPVTEQDIRKAYDARVASMPKQEYKLAHILTANAEAANAAIAELSKGTSFSQVALSHSTDPNTKANGGSLPWLNPQQMPESVLKAASGLQKSAYTRTPVQTDLGWHVFMLEDTRAVTPPGYESVKDQLRSMLENERISQHVAELKKTAKIEVK